MERPQKAGPCASLLAPLRKRPRRLVALAKSHARNSTLLAEDCRVPRVVFNPCSFGPGLRARVEDNPWHPAALRSRFLARLLARATNSPWTIAGGRRARRDNLQEGSDGTSDSRA